jgi:hypothetical protein
MFQSIVSFINRLNSFILFSFSSVEEPISSPGKDFEHAGHESQHGTMALILLAALFGFQFLILYWKSKHYRSFQAVTLVGLWLVNSDFSLAHLLDNYIF